MARVRLPEADGIAWPTSASGNLGHRQAPDDGAWAIIGPSYGWVQQIIALTRGLQHHVEFNRCRGNTAAQFIGQKMIAEALHLFCRQALDASARFKHPACRACLPILATKHEGIHPPIRGGGEACRWRIGGEETTLIANRRISGDESRESRCAFRIGPACCRVIRAGQQPIDQRLRRR